MLRVHLGRTGQSGILATPGKRGPRVPLGRMDSLVHRDQPGRGARTECRGSPGIRACPGHRALQGQPDRPVLRAKPDLLAKQAKMDGMECPVPRVQGVRKENAGKTDNRGKRVVQATRVTKVTRDGPVLLVFPVRQGRKVIKASRVNPARLGCTELPVRVVDAGGLVPPERLDLRDLLECLVVMVPLVPWVRSALLGHPGHQAHPAKADRLTLPF